MTKLTKKILAVLLVLTAFCGTVSLTAGALDPMEELRQQLSDLVAEVEAIEDVGYTAMTWSAFSSARSSAKRVLNDSRADPGEIEGAIRALKATRDQLTLYVEPTAFEKLIGFLLRPFYLLLFLFGAIFSNVI